MVAPGSCQWCSLESLSSKETVEFLGTRRLLFFLYSHYILITSVLGWIPLLGNLPQPKQPSCPLHQHTFSLLAKPSSQFICLGGLTPRLCVASYIDVVVLATARSLGQGEMWSLFCTVECRIHMAIQMFYDNHFPFLCILSSCSFTSWTSFSYLLPIRTASRKDWQNGYWNCSLKVIDGVQSTCCFAEMCSSVVFLASHWLWDAC